MIKAMKNPLLVLVSQIQVLGIAVGWWSGLLKYPILAAVFTVVYELMVIIWKNLGKSVWDEVWEKELKPQAVSGLLWISCRSHQPIRVYIAICSRA